MQPIQAKFLTPRAPRRRKAPSSSAKKRKTKKAAPSSESSDAEDHLTPSDDDSPTKAAKTRAVKTPGSAVRTGGSFITKLKTPGKEVGAASDKVQAIGDSIQIADTVQASRANLQAPGANIKSRGPAVKIPREHFGTFKLTAPRNPVEATGADFSFFDVHNPDANHKDANAEHNAATNDGMGSTDASSAVNAGSPITTTKPGMLPPICLSRLFK